MPAVATLITNGTNRRPEINEDNGSTTGSRWYMVTGADSEYAARHAQGMPAKGDQWDDDYTTLKARVWRVRPEPGGHGVYFVQVMYREDPPNVFDEPAPDYVTSTVLQQSSGSETVYYDITGAKQLTNDGAGVPKLVTTIAFEVTKYTDTRPDLDTLVQITDPPKVNSDTVTLTNFLKPGDTVDVPAGQLVFAGFTPGYDAEAELYKFVYRLERRQSWTNKRPLRDQADEPILDGQSQPEFEETDVYESAAFMPLLG